MAILALASLASFASAQALYGVSNGFGTAANNRVYEINPLNGDLTNIQVITMAGFEVRNALAMAVNSSTNTMYVVLQTGTGQTSRRLATLNPLTGVATDIGLLGLGISSISFRPDGVLWAVSGDGATPPETLFTVNTSTAAVTQQFALGNGADGEVIAFHPGGLMYHSSGNGTALFESVNVATQVVTPIGQGPSEMFAMGWYGPGSVMLGSDIGSDLFSINLATGARTFIGAMSDQLGTSDNRGLAVWGVIPEPTTMSVLGLAALAALARRRKA